MSEQDPLAWLAEELTRLEAAGLRRRLRRRDSPQGAWITLDGRRLANFGANDYLGLAGRPLAEAVQRCVAEAGWGAGASPLVTGRSAWHERLEQALAEFERAEAALLLPTGYAANVAAITALAGKQDAVFSDQKNHASIIDGCRLSGARIRIYQHADPNHLEHLLRSTPARRRLIVTDGLFSMDGDLAPLADLGELAQRYGAVLAVDEAHATGVLGEGGRGAAEACGAESLVHVKVGTLSKALGSVGGFVAGRRDLIAWLAQRARPYVYSTAAPPAAAAAALAALDVVRGAPQRRRELLGRAAALRRRLQENGWNTGRSAAQIIPLQVGDAGRTMSLAERLERRGVFVPGIRPPSVPAGQSLLRVSLCWSHEPSQVERLVQALAEARQ